MKRKEITLIACVSGFLAIHALSACHDIAEFENLSLGKLTVYTEDFAVIRELGGIEEARQVLVYPGYVFVITGNGTIEKYDSESLELLGSYIIGQPSPAGYSSCSFSPSESSLYVIGSVGKIIEVSIPSCSVVDEFTMCSSPVELSVSDTNPAYLYIIDGSSNTLWAVRASSNLPVDSWVFPAGVTSIEASESDTTLVATEVGTYRLEFLLSGGLTAVFQLIESFTAMEYIPWNGNFAAVTSSSIGIVEITIDPGTLLPALSFGCSQSIEGINHLLSCDNDRYAYVTSFLGGGMGRIVKYDMEFHEIENQIDISGTPLDMDVSGSGFIYVLTVED